MTLTKLERLKIQITKAMAERDILNADYVLKKEALDNTIAELQNEIDNIEAYGDMAVDVKEGE